MKIVCYKCFGWGMLKTFKYLMPRFEYKSYDYVDCDCCGGKGFLNDKIERD